MRALLYTGPNQMELTDLPAPIPAAGEVLVAVHAVGICGSDMHAYHGHDDRRPAPLVLGHEAAGIVAEGPRKGQAVAINPLVVD
ncbi:MAG: alcohol dehydrogenase catalytic domain-containing protein, partial [Alphaproteobacteria bacterium]|nr:alcohol dehydrogenase catalytic domain-containing protein [Alphaproteobacteria bacterium]